MTSFEDIGMILDDIADALPEDFFRGLNGGINLLPDIKIHPQSDSSGNLFIMGEYRHDPRGLGRYINIYYGSFMKLYAHANTDIQKEKLRNILLHEFTHHWESLGGVRTLALKDAHNLMKYKSGER